MESATIKSVPDISIIQLNKTIESFNYTEFEFFWQKESPFSQWYLSAFYTDGNRFNCCEQYMMWRKAVLFNDHETVQKILKEKSPYEQKKLGEQVSFFDQRIWDENKVQIVYEGNYHKFTQNEDLLKILFNTKGELLVEASPFDNIWGIGLDAEDAAKIDPQNWPGENLLGKILTVLRVNQENIFSEVENAIDNYVNIVTSDMMGILKSSLHTKSRFQKSVDYPERLEVCDEKVGWDALFSEYSPIYFVSPKILALPEWADSEDIEKVDRPFDSFEGPLKFDKKNHPMNPRGRTGITGRGELGKWGANFAGDSILTRKNLKTGNIEMLVIERNDTRERMQKNPDTGIWEILDASGERAIPGGMADPGELPENTLIRELREETSVDLDMSKARIVYQGYCDDPRNTDNAWVETTVGHLHLPFEQADALNPVAGDDAKSVEWMPLVPERINQMYANHQFFAEMVVRVIKN